MRCNNCGAKINNDNFCFNCGAPTNLNSMGNSTGYNSNNPIGYYNYPAYRNPYTYPKNHMNEITNAIKGISDSANNAIIFGACTLVTFALYVHNYFVVSGENHTGHDVETASMALLFSSLLACISFVMSVSSLAGYKAVYDISPAYIGKKENRSRMYAILSIVTSVLTFIFGFLMNMTLNH